MLKILGVVFDSNLSLSDHISQAIKSTRGHARDLYRICTLLNLKTSVLANWQMQIGMQQIGLLQFPVYITLTDYELRRLQHVPNSMCRVVTPEPQEWLFPYLPTIEKKFTGFQLITGYKL